MPQTKKEDNTIPKSYIAKSQKPKMGIDKGREMENDSFVQ
jgi:hypothetical protein